MGKEIYNIINDMAEVLNASQMQKLQEVLVNRKRSRVSIPDLVCTISNIDFNLSVFFSVQNRILQQIIDHLPEHRLISTHLPLACHGNMLSLCLRKLLIFSDQCIRLCAHIDLCLSANPACLAELRESKRLLDHTIHVRDILKHLLRIIFHFR